MAIFFKWTKILGPEPEYYDDDQSYVPSYYAPTYEPPPEYYDDLESLEVFETLPAETSLIDPNLQCYERTCDQNITGRDMTYERALEIIQTEEYLTAADIDLIHKRADVNLR